jgi:tRNA A37 threonylcarbamoyladenosine dehydratase
MSISARTGQLLGEEAVAKLRGSTVAVFGLGGVGSFAVEALARAGIGTLRIVDHDTVQPSNLNRQLFALKSTIGMYKVDVAGGRIRDINSACAVEARRTFADRETVPGLLEPKPDVIIDAIDAVGPKAGLICSAVQAGIFVVTAMGAAARTDIESIRIADISESYNCPLARYIRKRLHRRGIYEGVRCVFSPEGARNKQPVIHATFDGEPVLERGRPRMPLGSISYMPAAFGLNAARETIRYILER